MWMFVNFKKHLSSPTATSSHQFNLHCIIRQIFRESNRVERTGNLYQIQIYPSKNSHPRDFLTEEKKTKQGSCIVIDCYRVPVSSQIFREIWGNFSSLNAPEYLTAVFRSLLLLCEFCPGCHTCDYLSVWEVQARSVAGRGVGFRGISLMAFSMKGKSKRVGKQKIKRRDA